MHNDRIGDCIEVFSLAGHPSLVPCIPGKTSDGYHTFDELYEHRCLLYLAFLKHHSGWKSRKHADGSAYPNWFVVGANLDGQQITYHLPDRMWELAHFLTEYEVAPVEWDGHSANDVCTRLRNWIQS